MTLEHEKEFLRESNAIEGVFDDVSLEQAVVAWEYLKEQKILTPDVVLKTHKILMLHQPLHPAEKGYFRKVTVTVGGRPVMHWKEIPLKIDWWCKAVMSENDTLELHVVYETIHPFVDGNGRTGRMFMNWHRLKAGLPLLIIKAEERKAYYEWFL